MRILHSLHISNCGITCPVIVLSAELCIIIQKENQRDFVLRTYLVIRAFIFSDILDYGKVDISERKLHVKTNSVEIQFTGRKYKWKSWILKRVVRFLGKLQNKRRDCGWRPFFKKETKNLGRTHGVLDIFWSKTFIVTISSILGETRCSSLVILLIISSGRKCIYKSCLTLLHLRNRY